MREVIEGFLVALFSVRGNFPEAVFNLAIDEVVDGGFQLLETALLQITKHLSRSDEVGCSSDADCSRIRKSDHLQTAFRRNALAIKNLRHDGAAKHLVEVGESR